MKRVALFVFAAVLFAGCAGGFENFKTGESFQAYVNGLDLSQLSVAEASSKLASKGFECKHYEHDPPGEVACIRGIAGQQQAVRLSPSPGDSNRCVVIATLTFIAA